MRFLSMIRVDETTGQQPSQRLMDEMMALVGDIARRLAMMNQSLDNPHLACQETRPSHRSDKPVRFPA